MEAHEVLSKQVDELTGRLNELTSEKNEFKDVISTLTGERDTWKVKAEEAANLKQQNEHLQGQVRHQKHYAKFAELARAAGAKDKMIEPLWRASNYKAEADEPDEKALGDAISKLADQFDISTGPNEKRKSGTPERSGAVGTGHPADHRNREHREEGPMLTPEMMADPKFMLDPATREYRAAAAANIRKRQGEAQAAKFGTIQVEG